MGIDISSARFLISESRNGVSFRRTITLGRQSVYMSRSERLSITAALATDLTEVDYADSFFKGIGAQHLDFLDATDYEGANVCHDLNCPLPLELAARYDCVFDGGSLEHVFNFPVALKSCMEMVVQGGHLVLATPWHNFAGHGFYQFSPELFCRVLSPENGFRMERMLIAVNHSWYEVEDPAIAGNRVEISTSKPVTLFVSAKRVKLESIYAQWPQQSDYRQMWAQRQHSEEQSAGSEGLKEYCIRKVPIVGTLQAIWRRWKRQRVLRVGNNKAFHPVPSIDGIPCSVTGHERELRKLTHAE